MRKEWNVVIDVRIRMGGDAKKQGAVFGTLWDKKQVAVGAHSKRAA